MVALRDCTTAWVCRLELQTRNNGKLMAALEEVLTRLDLPEDTQELLQDTSFDDAKSVSQCNSEWRIELYVFVTLTPCLMQLACIVSSVCAAHLHHSLLYGSMHDHHNCICVGQHSQKGLDDCSLHGNILPNQG